MLRQQGLNDDDRSRKEDAALVSEPDQKASDGIGRKLRPSRRLWPIFTTAVVGAAPERAMPVVKGGRGRPSAPVLPWPWNHR